MWPRSVAHDCDYADACETDAAAAEQAPRVFVDEDDQGFLRKTARSPIRMLRSTPDVNSTESVSDI